MNLILRIFRKMVGYREDNIKNAIMLGVKVGKNCVIYDGVWFGSEPYLVKIGDYVQIANNVKFFTHDGGIWVLRNLKLLPNADIFGEIAIGNNVHIGYGAYIMPNVNIGDNCVIGSGAIVTKDIPSNSVAAGIPARVIKTINEYYEQHKTNCDFTKSMSYDEKKEYLLKKYQIGCTDE